VQVIFLIFLLCLVRARVEKYRQGDDNPSRYEGPILLSTLEVAACLLPRGSGGCTTSERSAGQALRGQVREATLGRGPGPFDDRIWT
jgi:hypothetical protein